MRYARNTQVSTDRSITEIKKTVERYGAKSFLFATTDGFGAVGFELGGRAIRIRLPMPKLEEFTKTDTGRSRREAVARVALEQSMRQRWRALALVVKAKLEAVESGISTVDDEFLAFILMDGKRTVGEILQSDVAAAYFGDKMPKLLPPAFTKEDEE